MRVKESPDGMEMPCQCQCGKWMELNDSRLPPYASSGETVCDECYEQLLDQYHEDRAMDIW